MRIFGLIGNPLSHSFSELFFAKKFEKENISDACYELYQIDNISEISELIEENPDLKGLNVTIPYKESVIEFLDDVDPIVSEIGAVNTIKIFRKGNKTILRGYNTDIYGFEGSFMPLLGKHNDKALIMGTGGASKAVQYCLEKRRIHYHVVSRNPTVEQISYSDLNRSVLDECKIIVNCTPIGMSPNTKNYPDIPYEFIGDNHYLFDMIYNPAETEFLRKGGLKGAKTKNGLEMLHLQAERSWDIWNSRK